MAGARRPRPRGPGAVPQRREEPLAARRRGKPLEPQPGEMLARQRQRRAPPRPGFGLNAAAIDRLTLTPARIEALAEGLRQVAALPDPVGEVRDGSLRPNGLQVQKVGVPLGRHLLHLRVAAERHRRRRRRCASRAATPSSSAAARRRSTRTRPCTASWPTSWPRAACPRTPCSSSPRPTAQAVGHLLKLREFIDLAIPRGGEGLIRRVVAEATMPVLKHYERQLPRLRRRAPPTSTWPSGSSSTPSASGRASATRPRACWSTRTSRRRSCRGSAAALAARGVELRGCDETRERFPPRSPRPSRLRGRVPRPDPVREGRRLARRGDRAHRTGTARSTPTRSSPRDLAAARRFVAARSIRRPSWSTPAPASTTAFELGLGRRDRHQHRQVPRPRPVRPARADSVQVRRLRRRPGPLAEFLSRRPAP